MKKVKASFQINILTICLAVLSFFLLFSTYFFYKENYYNQAMIKNYALPNPSDRERTVTFTYSIPEGWRGYGTHSVWRKNQSPAQVIVSPDYMLKQDAKVPFYTASGGLISVNIEENGNFKSVSDRQKTQMSGATSSKTLKINGRDCIEYDIEQQDLESKSVLTSCYQEGVQISVSLEYAYFDPNGKAKVWDAYQTVLNSLAVNIQ